MGSCRSRRGSCSIQESQRALSVAEQSVLDMVSRSRRLHPRDLEASLGKERETNAWGGYSKSTTRVLEALHYLGLIRIAGRNKGIKLYQRAALQQEELAPEERLRRLALLIAGILAPAPQRSLTAVVQHLRYAAPDLPGRKNVVAALLKSGELESAEVDGVRYLWPAGRLLRKAPEDRVRFLAPFDPLVWDRRRFELFWGWPYRFEAYTPPAKRKLGYYALPLLWRAEVIGWVNAAKRGNGPLDRSGICQREAACGEGLSPRLRSGIAKPAGLSFRRSGNLKMH